ncbi:hypothetical protein D3C85_1497200 [compost metagenome]
MIAIMDRSITPIVSRAAILSDIEGPFNRRYIQPTIASDKMANDNSSKLVITIVSPP